MKPLSESQRRSLESATNRYRQALREAPADHPWNMWLQEKGFDSTWVADEFRLGLVDRASSPLDEPYVGWLAVPNLVRDRYGHERVVGLKFRNPNHSDPGAKYMYRKGQEMRLYNLRALHQARHFIILTEGETDAWSVAYAGLPVVAIPGANTFGGENSHRLRIFGSPSAPGFQRVIVLQDPDEAGQGLISQLESIEGLEVKQMPKGFKDPSEFLIGRGRDELKRYILAREEKKQEEEASG